jgi:hypothetical protein
LVDNLKYKKSMINPNLINKLACVVILILITLIGASCGKARVTVHHDAGKNWDYPKTVAILPFSSSTEANINQIEENKATGLILRKVFFNYFSYLGYNDIPLNTVDLKLEPIIKSGINIEDISTGQLIKTLGVDAVIRGQVINSTNFAAGIYAETSIEAQLEMIDLRTDKVLWDTKHTELDSSGIATPSLLDMIEDQAGFYKVREAYHQIAESFALKIVEKIPDPASLRHDQVRLPQIISVDSNIKGNSKLLPDDVIYVSMEGESDLVGYFDIGNFKTRVPMKEVSPGLYTGSYRVKKTDQIDNALIIASLSNKKGLTAKKFFKKALATQKN